MTIEKQLEKKRDSIIEELRALKQTPNAPGVLKRAAALQRERNKANEALAALQVTT